MKQETELTVEPSTVRVLKIASCPTLSGKSTLTYHIGCKDGAEVQFRIYGNTGGGLYSNDWLTLKDIQRAFGSSKLVTSGSLQSACKGKSANTAGFVLAALKQEGLVARSKEDPRKYCRIESDVFNEEVRGMINSTVNLDPDAQPAAEPKPGKVQGKRSKKTVSDASAGE